MKGAPNPMCSAITEDGQHILKILRDITAGTSFIHKHGEIHRDLKPANGVSPHSSLC